MYYISVSASLGPDSGEEGRTHQRDDDLAVRVRLVVVRDGRLLAQHAVVIDLAVDGQCNSALIVDKRLRARVCDV
jgi:hypothetical protein